MGGAGTVAERHVGLWSGAKACGLVLPANCGQPARGRLSRKNELHSRI